MSVRRAEISERLEAVRHRLGKALGDAGRSPASVTLIAVSKTRPAEEIAWAMEAGQLDFGESYGQEFRDKHAALAAAGLSPRWHFIGPLQSNKVKYVAGKTLLIHSIDHGDLLGAVQGRLSPGQTQDCLVQVNVAGEKQKKGLAPAALPDLLDQFGAMPQLRCNGLMTIPPAADDPEAARPYFSALRHLRDEQAQIPRANVVLRELSMGMSHDLEAAIHEGATLIRIGTAIFGERA